MLQNTQSPKTLLVTTNFKQGFKLNIFLKIKFSPKNKNTQKENE